MLFLFFGGHRDSVKYALTPTTATFLIVVILTILEAAGAVAVVVFVVEERLKTPGIRLDSFI